MLASSLGPPHVAPIRSAYLDDLALLNEERHLDCQPGFESGGFLYIAGSVAFDALGRFGDFHLDGSRQVDRDRFVIHVKDAVSLRFNEKILGVFDETFVENDVFESFRIHKMVAVLVDIAELELYHVRVHDLDAICGTDLGIGAGTGIQVAHGDLHEAGLAALGAVQHIEHEVWIALVVENFAFTDVGGRCHEYDWLRKDV
mgnify:CR=1 FL=1